MSLDHATVADACALAGLAVVGGLILSPVISAGFVLVDDHEILSFTPPALGDPELAHPPTLLDRIFVADPAGGRVRPLYYVIRYAQILVLGDHPMAWHVLYVALGVLSAALLFAALRGMGITRLTALISAAWLLVAPGMSEIWIRLGPQESLGTLFVLVAVWTMIRGLRPDAHAGWNWLFVVVASATTLIKESFALLGPALFALRLLVLYTVCGRSVVSLRSALWPAAAPLAAGAAMVSIAFVTVQRSAANSYGARFLAPEVQNATFMNLQILALLGGIALPLLGLGALLVIVRRRRISSADIVWFGGAVVVCLTILPQLVLYQHTPGFAIGRYVLPSALGLVGGFAAGANYSRANRQRLLFVVVVEVWMLVLCFGAAQTWLAAESFRSDSIALSRLVGAIVRSAPPAATIVIAADPVENYEFAVSLPYQLAASGRPDLDTRLVLTPSDDARAAWMGQELANSFVRGRVDQSDRGCADVAAVVVFSDEQLAERALPCLATAGLHLESFSETASLSDSLPPAIRAIFPPITRDYSVLLP